MPEVVTFADCWVNSNNPNQNRNTEGLAAGKWIYLNRTFLRFAIPQGSYSRATLKLYGRALYSPARCKVYYCSSGFTETTLTWNNQPPPSAINGNPGPWGTLDPVPSTLGWFSIEIDPYIVNHRAGTNLNLLLKGEEVGADSYFYAEDKEAGSAYAPRLVLQEAQLAATLEAVPASGPAPLAVTFNIGISGGVLPYTWSLNPGDGSAPYTGTRTADGSFTQAHTYTAAGTFTATLTVTDALGATAVKRTTTSPGGVAPSKAFAIGIAAPLIAGAILVKAAHR